MNLLAFMSGFESALESQRHNQAMDVHHSLQKRLETLSPLPIESDARDVYTSRVFVDVQKEILGSCYDVHVLKVYDVDNVRTFELQDTQSRNRVFVVCHNRALVEFGCSCKLFMRIGYHCRHVFYAMRAANFPKIPKKYVLNRWTISCLRQCSLGVEGLVNLQCENNNLDATDPSIIWTEFNACLSLVGADLKKIQSLTSKIKDLRIELEMEAAASGTSMDQNEVISSLIGATVPNQLTIKSPSVVSTKGSGKRFVGERESAIERSKRLKKVCGLCKKFGYHDRRTCPLKSSPNPASGIVSDSMSGDIQGNTYVEDEPVDI